MGLCSCYCVADLAIVDRRLYVVFVWIKARAGRVGFYLKSIVTCVINFPTLVRQSWYGCGMGTEGGKCYVVLWIGMEGGYL